MKSPRLVIMFSLLFASPSLIGGGIEDIFKAIPEATGQLGKDGIKIAEEATKASTQFGRDAAQELTKNPITVSHQISIDPKTIQSLTKTSMALSLFAGGLYLVITNIKNITTDNPHFTSSVIKTISGASIMILSGYWIRY